MSQVPPHSRSVRPLFLLLAANIAFTVSAWYLAFTGVLWAAGPAAPLYSWQTIAVAGITCAQFILFAVWITLTEFRRSLRWPFTLAVITVFATLLAAAHYVSGGVPSTPLFPFTPGEETALLFAYVVTIGVFVILLLQIAFWPAKASLGWSISYGANAGTQSRARFSLSQLFMWIGLIAALLAVVRTILELNPGWIIFTVLWLLFAALAALPSLVIAARARPSLYLFAGLIAYIPALSFSESEFTAAIFSLGITRSWWPMWFVMQVNLAICAAVLINVLMLRGCGVVIDLPLWPRRQSKETSTALPTR